MIKVITNKEAEELIVKVKGLFSSHSRIADRYGKKYLGSIAGVH